jgi:hypothetical protein
MWHHVPASYKAVSSAIDPCLRTLASLELRDRIYWLEAPPTEGAVDPA